MNTHPQTLLKVRDLKVWFGSRKSPIRAVDGVSFDIPAGATVALVGESGCGKSVTAMALARLIPSPPARYESGQVLMANRDVLAMKERELALVRGAEISYVFQEPGTALNPVFTVGYQIGEALRLHRRDVNAKEETVRLLELVGIPDAERRVGNYPHELSGGMQQRVMIAIALACRPKLLVADEPTTALDVTIQAQILDLLESLQKKLGMAVLLITHNLGLVADKAHWIHVMYAGRIVESGPTAEVMTRPAHPYTRGLMDAVPRLEGSARRMRGIDGTVPNPARLPPGCKFAPRCSKAQAACLRSEAALEAHGEGRRVRCLFPEGGKVAS
jgi:oligopeptide/dipeptide ABC transporter ATP-binding protein